MEFRKTKRITIPEEIRIAELKRKAPDIGTYNPVRQDKIRNFALVLSPKCEVTNDFEFLGHQTPGHIYNHQHGSEYMKPRSVYGKIIPESKRSLEASTAKPVKSKDPDVGSYDPLNSYRRTQVHGVEKNSFKFNSGKGKTMTDIISAKTKGNPPVGTYKNIDSAYPKLSASPRSLRIRRH